MKKLFLLLSLVCFVSCSSDDEATNIQEEQLTTNGTLLRKIIATSSSEITVTEFLHNGNKLWRATSSNGSYLIYEYTGDLITKANNYDSNNLLKGFVLYSYNSNGDLIQRKSVNSTDNSAYRCDFIYNSDGTVSVFGYTGDATSQNNQVVNRKVFLFPNGDVEKIEAYLTINSVPVTRTYTYTYDNNNYAFNQILGNNKLKSWDTANNGNSHNILSTVVTSTEVSSAYPNTTNSSYTYNSYNFPITMTFNGVTFQYFYQQP